MLSVLAWFAVVGGLAWLLAASQGRARRDVAQRLELRTSAGAEFASLYVQDILAREHRKATSWLAARHVSAQMLASAAGDVGFGAAVLLDANGRVLRAVPDKPGLVGQVITSKYPHLAAAVAGQAAVSNVVSSAARGVPVVAFAVPFATPAGRRVFSGAYDVSKTPLGAYMSHLIVIPGRRVYLVDATGNVIASSVAGLKAGATLTQLDRRLAGAARGHATGPYDSVRGRQFFVYSAVAGTSWHIVAVVPEAQLYIAQNGADWWLSWGAVAGLALAGLIIIMMGSRLVGSRMRLAVLNGKLEHMARKDSLTGLRNRRGIEEMLLGALSAARRGQLSLAVLLIDIDHFKNVNDTLGHHAGDSVLIATAQAIESALRAEDTVGRWGGEEFLAVLPHTDADGALAVAERLRVQLASAQLGDTGTQTAVTVTVGVAVWTSAGMDDLVDRADASLYAGKAAGRNNVQIATLEPHHTPVST